MTGVVDRRRDDERTLVLSRLELMEGGRVSGRHCEIRDKLGLTEEISVSRLRRVLGRLSRITGDIRVSRPGPRAEFVATGQYIYQLAS